MNWVRAPTDSMKVIMRVHLAFLLLINTISYSLSIKIIQGNDIADYIPQLTAIRSKKFSNHPRITDSVSYNLLLLQQFIHASHAMVSIAYDNNTIVGYAPGIPLIDFYVQPITPEREDTQHLYYIHEILLLDDYETGDNIMLLYNALEQQVKNNKHYTLMAISLHHTDITSPLYMQTMERLGFAHYPELISYIALTDRNDHEIPVKLTYFLKGLRWFARPYFYFKFIKNFMYYYIWSHIV